MSLLLGRIGAVTSVLVDQADHLKSLDYSRSLEKEADINGLTLLKERQIDPDGYIRLFESLNSATEGESLPEFLKSHPDIKNRISYIQAAAVGATVNENKTLEEIFEKLK